MKILDQGIVYDATSAPLHRRFCAFTNMTVLSDGRILVAFHAGSAKEAPDENVLMRLSADGGRTWEAVCDGLPPLTVDGKLGSWHHGRVTELAPGHLLGAFWWLDRSDPGRPMINPETTGTLPNRIFLMDSFDDGRTWTNRREVDTRPFPSVALMGAPLVLADRQHRGRERGLEDVRRRQLRRALRHPLDLPRSAVTPSSRPSRWRMTPRTGCCSGTSAWPSTRRPAGWSACSGRTIARPAGPQRAHRLVEDARWHFVDVSDRRRFRRADPEAIAVAQAVAFCASMFTATGRPRCAPSSARTSGRHGMWRVSWSSTSIRSARRRAWMYHSVTSPTTMPTSASGTSGTSNRACSRMAASLPRSMPATRSR